MKTNTLLLVLVCLAAVTTEAKGGKRGGRGEGRFKALKECCPTFPLVLQEESIKTCIAAKKANRNRPSETEAIPEASGEDQGAEGTPAQGGTTRKGKRGKNRGDKANRGCMMECAFKADGFTTTGADGKEQLNMKALNDKLDTLATGDWEKVIKDAKANCTSTTPPTVRAGQNCTSGANVVAKCLYKYMFMNCPAPETSETCTQRREKISQWKGGRKRGKGKNRESEDLVQSNTGKNDELEAMVQDEGASQ